MSSTSTFDEAWIARRAEELTGRALPRRPSVVRDTTDFMAIDRDSIVELDGELFLVTMTERERRFGLGGEPKFWVKRAVSLATGRTHILKMVFHEAFMARVGDLETRCVRSAEKEARVLERFRGDPRFMHGRAVRDARGNLVRVLDLIAGPDLISHVEALPGTHQEYFAASFPGVLAGLITSLEAIRDLHGVGLCHGDIRNDHILVEQGTGTHRWIDFDLDEDTAAFDVWSLGNVLHHVVGKGFVVFRDALARDPALAGRLDDGDASVFFTNRVMNLRKLYPWVPGALNDVLMHFAAAGRTRYDRAAQVVDDLRAVVSRMGWPDPATP